MKCPYCGYTDTKVIDSRTMDDNTVIRRRRCCEVCGARFTTYERVDNIPLTVIKRDGAREPFSREKILSGIMKSCVKRPVSVAQMEKMVDEIENYAILNTPYKEIETQRIGEMVMEKLKACDQVSYVRYASIYREFRDIDTYINELTKLLDEEKNM